MLCLKFVDTAFLLVILPRHGQSWFYHPMFHPIYIHFGSDICNSLGCLVSADLKLKKKKNEVLVRN